MHSGRISLGVLPLLIASCSPVAPTATASPSPAFATATLPSPSPSGAASNPATPAASAVPAPVLGRTTTRVNVRDEPRASGVVLGILEADATVQVAGKDPAGNWYQIVLDAAAGKLGWVSSEYIAVEDENSIPPAGDVNGEPSAAILERINVRSGPGTEFDSLGTLEARDVVHLSGRDPSGVWMRINFEGGEDGFGWVAASFLEGSGFDTLPVIARSGEILATSTPPPAGPTPVPTVVPAQDDGDSAAMPAISIELSPAGAGTIIYSSDVSSPDGDGTDWVSFTPSTSDIEVRLNCSGNGELEVRLDHGGTAVVGTAPIGCGSETRLGVTPDGEPYRVKLSAAAEDDRLRYVRYVLTILAVR